MKELIIISDVHYAHHWDLIKREVPEWKENPNEKFKEFISKTNENQTIIINGDLIDYYYSDYNGKKESNWINAKKILNQTKAKIFCIPGNHDYYNLAYNLSFKKRLHLDFPITKKTGFTKFRFLKEFKAACYDKKTLKNIKENYVYCKKLDFNNKEIIMLDNGPNAITYSNIFKIIKYFKQMICQDPTALGLNNDQIEFLVKRLPMQNTYSEEI